MFIRYSVIFTSLDGNEVHTEASFPGNNQDQDAKNLANALIERGCTNVRIQPMVQG